MAVAALTLCLCASTAFAGNIDMNYVGEIDSFTGAPIDAVTEGPLAQTQISSLVDYDSKNGCFAIYADRSGGDCLYSNIVPDMVVTEKVFFRSKLLKDAQLYRNGTLVENVEWSAISEPGLYKLTMGDGTTPGAFSIAFTILDKTAAQLAIFQPPRGFFVTDVTRDEGETKWSDAAVPLEEDGHYQITYQCAATEELFTLDVIIDHTPPTLALVNVVDGIASGAVSLADLEPGARIGVSFNGEAITPPEVLTQSGNYMLQVVDIAGNSSTYQFTISVYFNGTGLAFIGLVFASIAGIVAYLWYSKTHLRVR
ncbi:MAG: hypothetical protein RR295_07215 [Oscillospiraceae bacterium]